MPEIKRWGTPAAPAAHVHTHVSTTGRTADDHHAQLHAAAHQDGAADEINLTGMTGLLSTAQTPLAHIHTHAFTHLEGDNDEIEVEDLATASTDTTQRLAPDGAGGLTFVAAAFDIRNNVVWDHFPTSSVTTQRVGKHGWSELSSGTGVDIAFNAEPGHPGIVDMGGGTTDSGRVAIYMGDGAGQNFQLGSSQNEVVSEWLIKFNADAVDTTPVNTERITLGFASDFDSLAGVEHANGVYVEYDPATSLALRLVTANASTRTKASGSTTILGNTWYRVGLNITYPAGVPTAELFLNGASEVSGQTANFPTVDMGIGYRLDTASTVAAEPRALIDYVRVDQDTDKED